MTQESGASEQNFEEGMRELEALVVKLEQAETRFVAVLRLIAHTASGAPALMGEARLTPAGG